VENSKNSDGVESAACFAAGLEVIKYFKRFVLSPYVDYCTGYSWFYLRNRLRVLFSKPETGFLKVCNMV
jgi:hypothetical protein